MVSFQQTVGLEVADDRPNGAASAHLAADGWGFDAPGLAEGDVEAFSANLVATVAAIHIGALDADAGQAGGLVDLTGQGVAVIGCARQYLDPEDELAALVFSLVAAMEILTPNS